MNADLVEHYRGRVPGAQTSSPHQQEVLGELLTGRHVARAVDVGCGRGANLALLAAHADRVVAADVSASALEEALAVNHDLAPRLRGVVLPGDGLPFADGSFDLVCCTEVLEHVADFDGTVAELQRVTRPGGLLLISTPNYRNAMGVVKAVMDRRRGRQDWDPWHAHAGGFERPVTIGHLRRAFAGCDELAVRGADYAFALGITNVRVRRRLSRYLLLPPGRHRWLAGFGMQCFLLLRRRA